MTDPEPRAAHIDVILPPREAGAPFSNIISAATLPLRSWDVSTCTVLPKPSGGSSGHALTPPVQARTHLFMSACWKLTSSSNLSRAMRLDLYMLSLLAACCLPCTAQRYTKQGCHAVKCPVSLGANNTAVQKKSATATWPRLSPPLTAAAARAPPLRPPGLRQIDAPSLSAAWQIPHCLPSPHLAASPPRSYSTLLPDTISYLLHGPCPRPFPKHPLLPQPSPSLLTAAAAASEIGSIPPPPHRPPPPPTPTYHHSHRPTLTPHRYRGTCRCPAPGRAGQDRGGERGGETGAG